MVSHGTARKSQQEKIQFVTSLSATVSKAVHVPCLPRSYQAMPSGVSQRCQTAAISVAVIQAAAIKVHLLMIATALIFGLAAAGCAPWKSTPYLETNDLLGLPVRQDSSRIVVEVEFINSSTAFINDSGFESLWQYVDETVIDSDRRHAFLENGLRVGKIQNLDRFREAIETSVTETNVVDDFLAEASVASEVSHGTQTVPLRLGKRSEFPLRQPFEGSHVALIRDEQQTIGKTLDNAQYFLGLTATEANHPKQIRLAIEPMIQHGNAKQKWVSSESAIRIDTRRETWDLTMLNLTTEMRAGDTIVFAPTRPQRGIGPKMLSGKGEDQSDRELIVLIHVTEIPLPSEQIRADTL